MKRYSLLHPLLLSFYSKDLYRDVVKNWSGIAFKYLVILIALTSVFVTIALQRGIEELVDEKVIPYARQLPMITVTNNEVSIDENVPYKIVDKKTNEVVGMIDTSGHYNSLDETSATVLVTKTKVFIRQGPNEVRTYQVNGDKNFTLTQEDVISFAEKWKSKLWMGMYPAYFIFAFLKTVLQVFFIGGIGFIYSTVMRAKLHYKELVRIAAIAITPATLVGNFAMMAQIPIPYQASALLMASVAYMYYGVKATKQRKVMVVADKPV